MKGTPDSVTGTELAAINGFQQRIGRVELCNNEDGHYACYFETRQEVNDFIKKLEKARDEVFE